MESYTGGSRDPEPAGWLVYHTSLTDIARGDQPNNFFLFNNFHGVTLSDQHEICSRSDNGKVSKYLAEWSHITKWIKWNPNVRYRPIGSADPKDTADMIQATKTLLGAL